MKLLSALSFAALASPLVVALALPKSKIEFAIPEGSRSTKAYAMELQLSMEEFSMTINGSELPMLQGIVMKAEAGVQVMVSDEYVSMANSAPTSLKRTYDKLSDTRAVTIERPNNSNFEIKANSKLQGKTVVFDWNTAKSCFDTRFTDEKSDKELLPGLLEDMDLRGLLPEVEVTKGDKWTISPASLSLALAPGGDLKFVSEKPDNPASDLGPSGFGSYGDSSHWFNEKLSGEVTATFEGTDTSDDEQLAVITIVVDVQNQVDLRVIAPFEPQDDREAEYEATSKDLKVGYKAEGKLLWDLSKGRAHSFHLSGKLSLVLNLKLQGIAGRSEGKVLEQTIGMSGTMANSANFQ